MKFLKNIFGKSPKTTVIGLVGAAVIAVGVALEEQAAAKAGEKKPVGGLKEVAIAAAIAALGKLAKDEDGEGQ